MNISVFVWPLVIPILVLVGLIILGVFLFIIFKLKHDDEETPWPYRSKRYFFSRSEQEFLQSLNAVIDHQKFVVFPKVRLADFIEVTAPKNEYQSWWNKIRSKHIDYLIWDIQQSKIVLAIEVDGKSHESEKMKARDEFVEKLYETIGMKLQRVRVGDSFEDVCRAISNELNALK